MSEEKLRLLDNKDSQSSRGYGDQGGRSSSGNIGGSTNVLPVGTDELPPSYSSLQSGTLVINCKVCNFMIDISGRKDHPVVKCSNCNEATPIKNAPPGKKYVRCPCNCLLICKSNSERIACPRPHCKRVINLSSNPTTPSGSADPGMCQVSCAHCHSLFLFSTLNDSLARCPHCQKVSSVGSFAKRRGFRLLALSLLILLASAVTVGFTYQFAGKYWGMYVIFIGLAVATFIPLGLAIRFLTMKVSVIEISA